MPRLELPELVRGAQQTGPLAARCAGRLMSLVTDEPQRLAELLAVCREWPQPRLVLGLTGSPGSGKSTLTDRLVSEYRTRFPADKIGVIAVDPSSPFTGGALLGDRVRMMQHATDPQVFIRSLASRGRLGGLALGVKGVVRVMGLVGCRVVLIETVGVGQSEVEIAEHADLTAVVLAPGQGDGIQLLKAGLLEVGDLFVINKADRDGAAALQAQLLAMLQRVDLVRHDRSANGVATQVCHDVTSGAEIDPCHARLFLTSAREHLGIAELVEALEARTEVAQERWRAQREQQIEVELQSTVLAEIERRAICTLRTNGAVGQRFERLLGGAEPLAAVVDEVLRRALEGTDSHSK